jgi:hypothetical protein
MPRFSFHVQRGKFANSPIIDAILKDNADAWRAGADLCADLAREIVAALTPTEPEWRVAVVDETGNALYRFRLVGETVRPDDEAIAG